MKKYIVLIISLFISMAVFAKNLKVYSKQSSTGNFETLQIQVKHQINSTIKTIRIVLEKGNIARRKLLAKHLTVEQQAVLTLLEAGSKIPESLLEQLYSHLKKAYRELHLDMSSITRLEEKANKLIAKHETTGSLYMDVEIDLSRL